MVADLNNLKATNKRLQEKVAKQKTQEKIKLRDNIFQNLKELQQKEHEVKEAKARLGESNE